MLKGAYINYRWQIAQNVRELPYAGICDFLNIPTRYPAIEGHGCPEKPAVSLDGEWRAVAYVLTASSEYLENPYSEVRHEGTFCAICLPYYTSFHNIL